MKLFKRVATAIMALVVSCGTFVSANKKAYALDNTLSHLFSDSMVYYLTDSRPCFSEDELQPLVGSRQIIYDYRFDLTESVLQNLYSSNYFLGYRKAGEGISPMFIFDIKTFSVDSNIMTSILLQLKDFGWTTVIITPYDYDNFTTIDFASVDKFIRSYEDEIGEFVYKSVKDYIANYNADMLTIFVNHKLVPEVTDVNFDLIWLYDHNYFIRCLIAGWMYNFDYKNTSYDFQNIKDRTNLLVHIGNGVYVDLFKDMSDREPLKLGENGGSDLGNCYSDYCAFGETAVESAMYGLIYTLQQHEKRPEDLPVYLLINDPIEEDPDGVVIRMQKSIIGDISQVELGARREEMLTEFGEFYNELMNNM